MELLEIMTATVSWIIPQYPLQPGFMVNSERVFGLHGQSARRNELRDHQL
jgi:hypothetical protein